MILRSKIMGTSSKNNNKIDKSNKPNKTNRTAKTEKSNGVPDGIKWFSSAFLVVGAISGFYYWSDQSWLLRLIGLLFSFGFVGAIILQTAQGQLAWNTIKEARMEVRKVVWPTRKETVQTTAIVIAVVFLMAIILWALDGLLGLIMRHLLGQGS